jgi:arylsulfatase A-like enzyme
MKTILILLDSMNRHYLNAYGPSWVQTPNIDRLAARGLVFDNHFCGSMPCMPARREMMTGRLNFLENVWGPIEPWDDCMPPELRKRGVYSHMITDHYHYFHAGGENYNTLFNTWEFIRGQEGDAWHAQVKDPAVPKYIGRNRRQDWVNRGFMNLQRDEDYPTPQCFMRAADFLERNHDADNWHLHLEVFDPHEPFMCPNRYRDMYGDKWDWDKLHFDWPQYEPVAQDAEAVQHIRRCYAGTLTMADAWLGRLLDVMDRLDAWRDTRVILTTDHGHLLGEHGFWAKNYMFEYAELTRIPMIVAGAGVSPGRRKAGLTATIDLMPTLMDWHSAPLPPYVHGRSFNHLLGRDEPHDDAVLYGYFGANVNLTDGRYTYCRQPLEGSITHRHTAMPREFHDFTDRRTLANAEVGVFLPRAYGIPHFRWATPSHRRKDMPDFNPIYDLSADPQQQRPLRDEQLEKAMAAKMRELLVRYDAPPCQYERLGL